MKLIVASPKSAVSVYVWLRRNRKSWFVDIRRQAVPVDRVEVRDVADEVAVLAEVIVLVGVVHAGRPVDELLALRDEPEFLRERRVVVEALGLCDRPRRTAIEREPAVAGVHTGVVADARAGVVVIRGARGQGCEAESEFHFEGRQTDFPLGRLDLHCAELIFLVLATRDEIVATRDLAPAADFVLLPLVGKLGLEVLVRS